MSKLEARKSWKETLRGSSSVLFGPMPLPIKFSDEKIPYFLKDVKDFSCDPSYTKFSVPYNIVCARRYANKRLMYEKQFENEINQLINYMDSGASAVIFARHMAYTSLWPPLHTRVEIKKTEKFFRLGRKQRERLNYLMENVIR